MVFLTTVRRDNNPTVGVVTGGVAADLLSDD